MKLKVRQVACLPILAAFLILAAVILNRSDALQPGWTNGVHILVFEARYLLGRWPRDWTEATRVNPTKWEGARLFREILIAPIDADRARVTVKGTNLLGFPYSHEDILEWTPARRDLIHSQLKVEEGSASFK